MSEAVYLLTGASGLLGGSILTALLDEGARVRVLVRDPSRVSIDPRAEVVVGDLLDRSALDALFDVADSRGVIVIHAASIVTLNPNRDELVYQTNVVATSNIIAQCVEHGVQKLVYVSSTGAIPERDAGPIAEVEVHDPAKVVGFYSQTKAEASNLVMRAVREQGLDASIVYPSGIIGPGDHRLGLVTNAMRLFASGRLPVAIGGSFNSVDVRDLADGVIRCARTAKPGTNYIMAGERHTFTELLTAVCEEAGVRRPWFTIPLWVLRPLAWIGDRYSQVVKKTVLLTGYTVYNLERNNDFSSERAARDLGFHSRPLAETVRDTVAWLRDEGYL